jgi:hypothetical protein
MVRWYADIAGFKGQVSSKYVSHDKEAGYGKLSDMA